MPPLEAAISAEPAPDSDYQRRIAASLQRAYRSTIEGGSSRRLQVGRDRVIVFSDLHKGGRNDADDFRRCERAYNAALAYYQALGYWLVELGDVEELWEEMPATVLRQYPRTLELTAQFHKAGRYIRIWGNHDDAWSFADKVKHFLHPIFGDDLRVHEGFLLHMDDGDQSLGAFFLVHGHQGTLESDRWSFISRFAVRWIWRPLQRLFNITRNTPAHNWALRERHNVAMYHWVVGKPGLVLVAGHTHRPVFASQSRERQLEVRRQRILLRLTEEPANHKLELELATISAELEWARAQDRQLGGREGEMPTERKCYFNTGCCCFLDGDIVGLEIADGAIRLVRWPDDAEHPIPQLLASVPLREIFEAVAVGPSDAQATLPAPPGISPHHSRSIGEAL
ncbi:MAG: hypothetical protein ACRENP_19250 [Longimicrobiales bacterium]